MRKGVVKDCVGEYGHLIVDECHHLSAQSFEQVVRRAKAKFVTGLSATLTRKDGRQPIIFMQCGPVRHCVDAKAQAAARPFQHTVLVRPTSFRPLTAANPDARMQFHDLYNELIADDARNQLICDEVVQAVREGRSPLVLTERNEHLDCLATRLSSSIRHLIVLRGGARPKEAQAILARLAAIPEHEDRALLATGRYIGEGFDDARLDTLFLTLPVSWRGTIAQYVGRLHRLYDRKREVRVYDYADLNVPMLARMFDRRCRGYEAVGYAILLPASAVPGWPADVSLPVDPQWKNEYAATVRRLVRDGVDSPLANLFVHAARTPPPGAEGVDRREVQPRRSFIGGFKPCRTPPVCSASMSSCPFPLTDGGTWKWICCAPTHTLPSSLTAANTWPTPMPTVATGAKIFCCRKMATSCCGSLPKTWASSSMPCSMQSCERCHISVGDLDCDCCGDRTELHSFPVGQRDDRHHHGPDGIACLDARFHCASALPGMAYSVRTPPRRPEGHFSEWRSDGNLLLVFVPMVEMADRQTTTISESIIAYSTAVGSAFRDKNWRRLKRVEFIFRLTRGSSRRGVFRMWDLLRLAG